MLSYFDFLIIKTKRLYVRIKKDVKIYRRIYYSAERFSARRQIAADRFINILLTGRVKRIGPENKTSTSFFPNFDPNNNLWQKRPLAPTTGQT